MTSISVDNGTNLKPRIDRLIQIRKATVAGGVQYLSTNSDVFVQQRDGGSSKPGSVLVINDGTTSNSVEVKTQWAAGTWLIDLVTTNSNTLVQIGTNGLVTLNAPARDYRIYGLTNSLSQ